MGSTEQWPARAFTVQHQAADPKVVVVKGRDRWALEQLITAGEKGCTPITNPGPRWSAYVHKLRKFGIDIDTLHESHEGPFPGHHARYVLKARVTAGRGVSA